MGDTTHPNARNAGDKCAHICVTEHFQRIVKKDIMENWWDKKLSKKNIGGGGRQRHHKIVAVSCGRAQNARSQSTRSMDQNVNVEIASRWLQRLDLPSCD